MAKKSVLKGTKLKGETKAPIQLPELKDLKRDKDGYKSITTTFDSEFLKMEEIGQTFIGKYKETIEAGKKGEEKPCALFEEKGTGKSYLIGSSNVMTAVAKYGVNEYRIIYKGKKKSKSSGFKYSDFDIAVKG